MTKINVGELTGVSAALAAAIVRNRPEVDSSEAAKVFFRCYDALLAENYARQAVRKAPKPVKPVKPVKPRPTSRKRDYDSSRWREE